MVYSVACARADGDSEMCFEVTVFSLASLSILRTLRSTVCSSQSNLS